MQKWSVQKTASKGYAIGPVFIVKRQVIEAAAKPVCQEQVEAEISRFEAAVETAKQQLMQLADEDMIFAGHAALAGDVAIYEGVTGRIRQRLANAEAALVETAAEFIAVFESMEDEYMRERAADMKDVSKRLLCALKGIDDNPFTEMHEKCIVAAQDLTPSDTARMDMSLVLGFITEEGGVTSHVSIIAKNMAIPCLVGAGPILDRLTGGMTVIMDAAAGEILLQPEPAMIQEYQQKAAVYAKRRSELEQLGALAGETIDGHRFELCANVGNIDDIKQAVGYHIDGVGLFRSEFLYMDNSHFPTEEEQLTAYREAAELLESRELTIRTLDIGGDKGLDYFTFPKEENPFLGYRAIRMCLDRTDIFKTQLRALLRAGIYGNIRIMYPMLISLEELEQANELLEICKAELHSEQLPFAEKIPVGMMIETPAAVMMAAEFAAKVDFFSIGTNDLTQYMLAVDRGNQQVAGLYNSFHPAVLRAISRTIKAGHQQGIKVGMCGEFASDEAACRLLLGMGLDEFSMSAADTAAVKYQLRKYRYSELEQLAEKALRMETAGQVLKLLAKQGE